MISVFRIAGFMALSASSAYAQPSSWQVQVSRTGDVVAANAESLTAPNGRSVTGILNIAFGPKGGCRPELGLAVLTGNGYGSPVGKYSPPNTTPIILTVDATPVSTDAPYVMRYDNGFEAIVRVDGTVVHTLTSGNVVSAQLMSGTPMFKFGMAGSDQAVDRAAKTCVATR